MIRFASYPIGRTLTSIAVVLMLLSGHAPAQAEEKGDGQIVGFEDSQGKTLFLHDFKGKAVILNLWATWCEPCVEELPSLAKLQQEDAPKGLVVLALSEDESLDVATALYKKMNVTSLVPYFDKGHAVWAALQARGVPTTVLVSRDGTMMQRVEGPVDWQSAKVLSMVAEIMK